MNTSDRVKLLINKQNQTQKKFAEIIGISPARLNNYLAGISKIPQDILVKISESFNCDLTWLITGDGEMLNNVHTNETAFTKFLRLPVVGDIAAGYPIEVVPDEPSEFIEVSASLLSLPPPYYVFRVDGESMLPVIQPGDYVIISSDWRGIKLNGRICAFRTADGITLKQYILDSNNKTAWLWPINSSYKPVPYNIYTESCALIGVMVLSIRKYT